MKKIFIGIPLVIACQNSIQNNNETVENSITKNEIEKNTIYENENDSIDFYSDYYLVVADKSNNYNDLQQKMYSLHNEFTIEIDTLGRYYNTKRNEIILPEDDEDEIYAGSYFPRRFESESLSIEYEYTYIENGIEPNKYPATMLLIAGMYAEKHNADSLQKSINPSHPKSYVLKSKIYMGCMH